MITITNANEIEASIMYLRGSAACALKNGQKFYIAHGTEKPTKAMTPKQQGSLNLWCGLFADALNDSGQYRDKIKIDGRRAKTPWTKQAFKDDVYKVMLAHLTGKLSTQDQDTTEPSMIAQEVNLLMAEHRGVTVPWPCKEEQMAKSMGVQ